MFMRNTERVLAQALEHAPYMVYSNGLWVTPEADAGEDVNSSLVDYSSLADDYPVTLNPEGFESNPNDAMVPTVGDYYDLFMELCRVQGLHIGDHMPVVEEDIEHERDHLVYATEVLGADRWNLGLRLYKFPYEYRKICDWPSEHELLFYIPFGGGEVTGPKAGIAGLFAYPLEPSDGDKAAYQNLGYPTVEHVARALSRLGLVLPRSMPEIPPGDSGVESPTTIIPLGPASPKGPTVAEGTPEVLSPAQPNFSAIGDVAIRLETAATQELPIAMDGISGLTEALGNRIAQLAASIDEHNRQTVESQIDLLRQAQDNLRGASDILSGQDNSVMGRIANYLGTIK